MSEEVVVEKRDSQHVVSTHFDCTPAAMGANLEKILPMIWEYAESKESEVVGPPFLRYHAMMEGKFFLEAGLPVGEEIEGTMEFNADELPGGHMAIATHIGPYREIGATHKRVRDWIRQSEWIPCEPCWDSYIDDPQEVEDEKLRTLVIYPVERS